MKYPLLIIMLCIASLAFAVDWGGTLENSTSIYTVENEYITQGNNLTLWLSADFSDLTYFNVQASIGYTLDYSLNFDLIYAANLFAFQGDFPVLGESPFLLNLSLGRFTLTDFTGNVINHPVDGIEFGYSNSFMDARIAGGFTGFLFKKTSTVEMSIADKADKGNDTVFLAAPRIIGLLDVVFPELFLRQDITLSALVQFDLRSEDDLIAAGETTWDPGRGGRLDSYYFGLGIAGPITTGLYYDAFFYFQTGNTLSYIDPEYRYTTILAFLAGGGFRWYIKEALGSKLSLGVIFASGDNDCTFILEGNTGSYANMFIPISTQTYGMVFAPQIPNMFIVNLEYSFKPLSGLKNTVWENLQTLIRGTGFFRSSTGNISESGIDLTSEALYLGTELDIEAIFRPLSDMGLVLSVGAFLPYNIEGEGSFLEDSKAFEVLGRFEFCFNF